MFETVLFLGIPLSSSYQLLLDQLPLAERELFISSSDSSYLQKVENNGGEYLGKYLEQPVDMSTLELSNAHVYSLLKKLIPHFPYEDHPLFLLALQAQS